MKFRSRLKRTSFVTLFAVGLAIVAWSCRPTENVPPHVYLSWSSEDTSRSITVHFHSRPELTRAVVHYDLASRDGKPASYALQQAAENEEVASLRRRIHHARLLGLVPSTTYFFILSDGTQALTAEKKFTTLPDGSAPLTFVTGGDMGTDPQVAKLHDQAAKFDPQFALIGGDIAYDNGTPSSAGAWDQWLTDWEEHMVRKDGGLIPMALAIGNHEVNGGYDGTPDKALYYLPYFRQNGDGSYFTRKFGSDLRVYFLDTGHLAAQGGAQANWLRDELSKDRTPYRVAIYHVPLYPSSRDFSGSGSAKGREAWLPLFDQFRLTAAFENHDHAMKRTHPLRGGAIAEGSDPGTVYFGDGCWGKPPRSTDEGRWYLAHSEGTRHFWVVKSSSAGLEFQAVDADGAVRDSFRIARQR